MKLTHVHASFVVGCLTLGLPQMAWAQDTTDQPLLERGDVPSMNDEDIAAQSAMQAKVAYAQKEYAKAINLFATAHRYDPYAIYLFYGAPN